MAVFIKRFTLILFAVLSMIIIIPTAVYAYDQVENDKTVILLDEAKEETTIEIINPISDPIYISKKQKSVDLLKCFSIVSDIENITFNDFDFVINSDNISIKNGVLNLAKFKENEFSIEVRSAYNLDITATLNFVIEEEIAATDIDVPAELTLTINDDYRITPHLLPENNSNLLKVNYSYKTSNKSILTVDNNGLITPISEGTATVTIVANFSNLQPQLITTTIVNIVKEVKLESFRVLTQSVTLSTAEDGISTRAIDYEFTPVNTTQTNLEYSSLAPEVASVDESGLITAHALGRTTITVTAQNGERAYITVNVSNNKIISDSVFVSAITPDEFTVYVKGVKYNPALNNNNGEIAKVTCYAFSAVDMTDINAKKMDNYTGEDWMIIVPVNGTERHSYFNDASKINLHIYASNNLGTDGELINYMQYNYVNYGTSPTKLTITPYAQNIGFIKPSFGQNGVAGTVGQALSLEGIRISTPIPNLNISYSVYAKNIGWLSYVNSGQYAGTMFQSRPIEAIRINLSGLCSEEYRLEYRAHNADIGWGDWVETNDIAGSDVLGKSLEAIQVRIIEK